MAVDTPAGPGTSGTSASRRDAPVDAWLDAADLPAARAGVLRKALAAAGVRVVPDARNGIVAVLDPGRSGLSERLAALRGPGRMLVLSPSDRAIANSGWALLRAGASDVLAWNGDASIATVAQRLRRWHLVDELLDRPY